MSELKVQTMTAAMAATILGDIQQLVDMLVDVQEKGQAQSENIVATLNEAQKQLKLAQRELGNTTNDIYSKLVQSLEETQSLRHDMRKLINENARLSRRQAITSYVALFFAFLLALGSCWLIFGRG
ncbi:hypothetical protein FZI27_20285 [Cronobacter sakazakii]|nr:hypothetical protein FZI27_20285 [Cronobacter sakazakii]